MTDKQALIVPCAFVHDQNLRSARHVKRNALALSECLDGKPSHLLQHLSILIGRLKLSFGDILKSKGDALALTSRSHTKGRNLRVIIVKSVLVALWRHFRTWSEVSELSSC